MAIQLHPQLEKDTHKLGNTGLCQVLLHTNAHFPWIILVPDTDETEFYKLDTDTQIQLLEDINNSAHFIENNFNVDKMNIATIGNIVSQLHFHIIGRSKNDPCWPGVVWGCEQHKSYTQPEIDIIASKFNSQLKK